MTSKNVSWAPIVEAGLAIVFHLSQAAQAW